MVETGFVGSKVRTTGRHVLFKRPLWAPTKGQWPLQCVQEKQATSVGGVLAQVQRTHQAIGDALPGCTKTGSMRPVLVRTSVVAGPAPILVEDLKLSVKFVHCWWPALGRGQHQSNICQTCSVLFAFGTL